MVEEIAETVTCQYCSSEIPKGAIFCPSCGKQPSQSNDVIPPQPVQPPQSLTDGIADKCIYCGQTLVPDTTFCWNCGRQRSGAMSQSAPIPSYESQVPLSVNQPISSGTAHSKRIAKARSSWRYPFLNIVQLLMRILGVMTLLGGVGFIVMMGIAGAQIIRTMDQLNLNTAAIFAGGNFLMIIATIITAILMAFPFFVGAEFLQLFMDIEANQRIQLELLQSSQ